MIFKAIVGVGLFALPYAFRLLRGGRHTCRNCSRPQTRTLAAVASPFSLRSRHHWQPGAPLLTTQAGGTCSLNLKQQCHAPAAIGATNPCNAAVISVKTPASRP